MSNEQLQTELEKQIIRADRWREECRKLLGSIPAVFNSIQAEIEPQTILIDQSGFYRCCVARLRKIEKAEPETIFTCEDCQSEARLDGNVWKAVV